jgi:hypothetical protein
VDLEGVHRGTRSYPLDNDITYSHIVDFNDYSWEPQAQKSFAAADAADPEVAKQLKERLSGALLCPDGKCSRVESIMKSALPGSV